MEKITLNIEKREKKTKKEGMIPAVIYGPKTGNTPIFVGLNEFKKALKQAGESTLIELRGADETYNVLVQDVDLDPLSNEPRHVDFYAADLTKVTTASVPIEFVGEAPAIKLGGTLVKAMHELEVEAIPKDLPHQIEIDVSSLNTFDDKINVGDIKVSEGVKILAEPESPVAFVEEVKEEATEESTEINMSEIEATKVKDKEKEPKEEEKGEGN
ncbi:MAG: 50S ribosomal protein L25 [Patescibacteria group bacterium]